MIGVGMTKTLHIMVVLMFLGFGVKGGLTTPYSQQFMKLIRRGVWLILAWQLLDSSQQLNHQIPLMDGGV